VLLVGYKKKKWAVRALCTQVINNANEILYGNQ